MLKFVITIGQCLLQSIFYTSIYNNNIRSLCYGGIIGDRGCVLVDGFFITKSLPYGVPLGAAQYNIELYDDSMD